MEQPQNHENMMSYQFPRQKVLCTDKPFSHKMLHGLLDSIYASSPPFTGYFKFSDHSTSLFFLFFFNGTPYAAGKYSDGKPVSYSIRELGKHLIESPPESMTVSLSETDPVLLKSMLLFLQEEPAIKAPASLLDFEYIVRQLGQAGSNAMIALSHDMKLNFFFFKDGKAALAHYGDLELARPEGMTVEEELLLYAFQPEGRVQAFIFRDMLTTMAEDSPQIDKIGLFNLLTIGYPKNRRKPCPATLPPGCPRRRRADREPPPVLLHESGSDPAKQKPKPRSVVLFVESGPQHGERFCVTLPCTIGRKDCDLILDDRLISRRHAELKIVDNKLVIEDLNSTNGTKVNGKTISSNRLSPNDLISIGPASLRVTRAQ